MFLILSISILLQVLAGNVQASCDNEMCNSDEYDCSQLLDGCMTKNAVAACETNGVYYCILKKPKTGGPDCPICKSGAFDCSAQYGSEKCNPQLTKAICPDSVVDTIYYCVQLKIEDTASSTPLVQSTTQPPSTSAAPSTTAPIITEPSTTAIPSTVSDTTAPLSTTAVPSTTGSLTPSITEAPSTIAASTTSKTTPVSSTIPKSSEQSSTPLPTTTGKEIPSTTPSTEPGLPGHPCLNKFPELTPSGPLVCLPGEGTKACPAPIFTHAPLFECLPGNQCCAMDPPTTPAPTTTAEPTTTPAPTTTPEPTTTPLITTTTPSPTPGQPGQICGNKYPELTPAGLILCLPGTNEKACPAPVFTYAPVFECVPGYQCCSYAPN